MSDFKKEALEAHKKSRGMLETKVKVPLENSRDASIYYTPGMAEPCRAISENPEAVYELSGKWNRVAVVTDGSAILGLGNIGSLAGLPVMEGKSILFKTFGAVDAFPISLDTQDTEEIIRTIKNIAPGFGGINLEDISAPRCFEIEERLNKELDIPVFHDDQHATAIVCLASLINALKVVGKNKENIKVALSGAGAGGIAIAKLLHAYGIKNITIVDSKGIISSDREDLNEMKKAILEITNPENLSGGLADAIRGADVFLGVSKAKLVTQEMVQSMANDPIVIAMANPEPEIFPEEAKSAGAAVVATGRADFENQTNNALVFPGLFRGLLDARARKVTLEMKLAVAKDLAEMIENPVPEKIIPSLFDPGVADTIAEAVKKSV